MIIILIVIIFLAIALVCSIKSNDCDEIWAQTTFWGSIIALGVFGIVWGTSYSYYLDMRKFQDAGYAQQVEAIKMYKHLALDEIKKEGVTVITDLKFQGYQQEMAKLVDNFRKAVTTYNDSLIGKQKKSTNPFISWFIVTPDPDMKLLKMG